MSKPTVVSLFSDIGGIDLGFLQADFEMIWANEKDHFACVTYRNNFSDNVLSEADISTEDARRIPKCDVLIAGFPCQSFSVMGYQRGFKDPRSNLFFEIARIVDVMKPKVMVLVTKWVPERFYVTTNYAISPRFIVHLCKGIHLMTNTLSKDLETSGFW